MRNAHPVTDRRELLEVLPLLQKLHGGEIACVTLAALVGYFLGHPLRRDRYIDAAEFRVVSHALLMRHRLVVVVAMSLIDRLERGLHLGTGFDNNLHIDMRRW